MEKLAVIIPTGIGATIGGFAGDAGAYIRELSKKYTLIVNPNVVNAACFSSINENILYVEGYAMDLFFKKQIALRKSFKNKIGVIFDCAIPQDMLNIHINTLNAMKVVYGIDTVYEITDNPVGVEFIETSAGISSGNLQNPNELLEAAEKLLKKGCSALAPICLFEDTDDGDDYENGIGIDIVGGVEAIISHLLTKEFLVPVAHAPAFINFDISTKIVNPKAAAEYITPTFLPCIIWGLYNAPKLIPLEERIKDDIIVTDIKGLAAPYNSLGSIPVLKSLEYDIPVYGIKENQTVLNVDKKALNCEKIIEVEKYSDL